MYFPKREELSLRIVFAFPKAGKRIEVNYSFLNKKKKLRFKISMDKNERLERTKLRHSV